MGKEFWETEDQNCYRAAQMEHSAQMFQLELDRLETLTADLRARLTKGDNFETRETLLYLKRCVANLVWVQDMFDLLNGE